MNQLYPCLWCNHNALEMAEYYISIFPNAIITLNSPLVVYLEIESQRIMLLNGGDRVHFNPSSSLFVTFNTKEDLDKVYQSLTQGGGEMMKLGEYPWASYYTWFTDKYGLSWQLMLTENPAPQRIAPCFLFVDKFSGLGKEALQFYQSVFQPSKEYAVSIYNNDPLPEGMIKHAHFSLKDFPIRLMDGGKEHAFFFNEAISIVVECSNQGEIDTYWKLLTENGGEESMCGWLRDKFGISWQIIPENIGHIMADPQKSEKAMKAVMTMRKIDMKTLVDM